LFSWAGAAWLVSLSKAALVAGTVPGFWQALRPSLPKPYFLVCAAAHASALAVSAQSDAYSHMSVRPARRIALTARCSNELILFAAERDVSTVSF